MIIVGRSKLGIEAIVEQAGNSIMLTHCLFEATRLSGKMATELPFHVNSYSAAPIDCTSNKRYRCGKGGHCKRAHERFRQFLNDQFVTIVRKVLHTCFSSQKRHLLNLIALFSGQ